MQRKVPRTADDEAALIADIAALATQYGRCGSRRIKAHVAAVGWTAGLAIAGCFGASGDFIERIERSFQLAPRQATKVGGRWA